MVRVLGLVTALVAFLLTPASADGTLTFTGTLPSGATYLSEVPDGWNGTLLLYSHGYTSPGSPNPARNAGDPATHNQLLEDGYALAGSSYARTGWALEDAFEDQIALLDRFASEAGEPVRTIAWGHSLGGIITAGLVQRHPERIHGALPMCGPLSGGVASWNAALDAAFVIRTLVAPSLSIVNITDPAAAFLEAVTVLTVAQSTPLGRARLALAFAMNDIPGWFDPLSPEPKKHDVETQQANQFRWAITTDIGFMTVARWELEQRAGGNASWNTGVGYASQLRRSVNHTQVEALYRDAGADLRADLSTLAAAPRIAADPDAVDYLDRNISPDGDLRDVPVLTVHTVGDGLVVVQNERAYHDAVAAAGDGALLRQLFVDRAGHCTITPAEQITALRMLLERVDAGRWPPAQTPMLNRSAVSLGLGPASFVRYEPAPFLRAAS